MMVNGKGGEGEGDVKRGEEMEMELRKSKSTPEIQKDGIEKEEHGISNIHPTNNNNTDQPPPDIPPNGGYGWICVAAIATINAHTWGLNSAYAVFLAYYLSNSVFANATPLHYAFIGGLSISQALIVSPLATICTRISSTRTTLLIGVALETTSFIGASFASEIWHLFLTQGLCFGWGMGFLFAGSVGIAAQWFTTRRSLANGCCAAGSGIGGLIYSLAAQAMIRDLGLPWAFRGLAVVACVVNTVCALLVRDRNKQVGSVLLGFDWRLFGYREFLGLMAYGVLSMLGYIVLLFSLPNYARTVGLSAQQGSVVGAVLNLGQALGRPPIGYFSDNVGRLNMAASMTFLVGVFCLLIWMFAKSFGVLVFFALIVGCVAGTFWATVAPVTTEVMGLKRLPSALSITWLVLVLPTTCKSAFPITRMWTTCWRILIAVVVSMPIGLQIVAFNGGSYTGAILFTGWMYIGAAVFLWLVRAWKIGEMEETAAAAGKDESEVDPVTAGGESTPVDFQKSSLVKRIVMWRKV